MTSQRYMNGTGLHQADYKVLRNMSWNDQHPAGKLWKMTDFVYSQSQGAPEGLVSDRVYTSPSIVIIHRYGTPYEPSDCEPDSVSVLWRRINEGLTWEELHKSFDQLLEVAMDDMIKYCKTQVKVQGCKLAIPYSERKKGNMERKHVRPDLPWYSMGSGKHQVKFKSLTGAVRNKDDLSRASDAVKLLIVTNDAVDMVRFGWEKKYGEVHMASLLRNGQFNGNSYAVLQSKTFECAPSKVKALWSTIEDLKFGCDPFDVHAAQEAMDDLVLYVERAAQEAKDDTKSDTNRRCTETAPKPKPKPQPQEKLQILARYYEKNAKEFNGRKFVMELLSRKINKISPKQEAVLDKIAREMKVKF